jgi:hypothetical protein
MTLAELISEVYTLTGRPDRVAETASAIKSATLKAHQCDFFYKDIFESGVGFTTAEFVQNLDYRTLIPLWRSVKYLRKWDNTGTGTPGKFLDLIAPAQVMDRYQVEKDDIYYAAGAELTIKCSSPQQYFLIGAYVNPDITVVGYNSWIALDHPFAIVYDAAATVFKAIGKDEEAAAMRGLVAEQIAMVRMSNILAEGY